jgi:type II secretory pathway component PulF
MESGVNLLNCLKILSNQTANKQLKFIIDEVISSIKDGKSMSDSFRQHPKAFSGFFVAMVQSGETGGSLDTTLKRLADYLEKEEEFRNSVTSALIYPLFLFSVSILTIVVLLTFVIPRLVTMFEDMGQVLPLPTKILIDTSSFLRLYWWFILAIILVAAYSLKRFYSTDKGKATIDRLRLKLPVLGKIILKAEISRLMRTLSLLLGSGIPIVQAMGLATSVIDNQILKTELSGFKDKISSGSSLSSCLKESPLFPDLVTNVVSIGEESGTIEKSLGRIADDYEKEVDRALKVMTRLLEPTVILIMGLIVGFIVLSMLLPIFQINLIVR